MKTIAVSGELPIYRLCTACRSDNDTREITLAYDNGTFKQGTQITLCKECRKDLVKVLTEADRPQGKWVWNPDGMDWNIGAWVCSECRCKPETWWECDERYNPLNCAGSHFCGNCGADMRGDTK